MTMTDLGNGHVITAGELPYALVDNGNEVLYTPTGGYYGDDSFTWTATDGGGNDVDVCMSCGNCTADFSWTFFGRSMC